MIKKVIKFLFSLFYKPHRGLKTNNFTPKKRISSITNKVKRDQWLKSKGYVFKKVKNKIVYSTNYITSYQASVNKFINLKRNKLIKVYDLRNKQGIPFYELKR